MILFFRSGLESSRAKALHRLERVLGVRFRRLSLLHRALTHSSHLQNAPAGVLKRDNETLEFLGDAVLGLVISEELFRLYPVSEVGELAKVKAQVVSRATLGEIAVSLGLDQWIVMGPGEMERGEARQPSVIGSALEAVFGALYVDRGLSPTVRLIRRLFHHQIEEVEAGDLATDYKSLLQEYVLRYFRVTPEYHVVGESGPGHRRRFHVTVGWKAKVYGEGMGLSKKKASQEAAHLALEHLLSPTKRD